jgi:hypothetical protein
MHVFWLLSVLGGLLVIIGLGSLLWLIPFLADRFKNSSARTEFYSARASYWSVIAGLAVLVILAISAVVLMLSIYHR